MNIPLNKIKYVSLLLYLVSAHSVCTGIGLIVLSSFNQNFFGFEQVTEKFFPVQSGVFHLVMSIAYFLAGKDPIKNNILIFFSIVTKLIATLFLFIYYFTAASKGIILISALGDGLMFLALFYIYHYQSLLKSN